MWISRLAIAIVYMDWYQDLFATLFFFAIVLLCFPKFMDQRIMNHDGRTGRGANMQHMQNCTAEQQSADKKLIQWMWCYYRLMFTDFISILPFDLRIYSLLCLRMCFDQFSVVDSVFVIELFHVFTLSFHCYSEMLFLLFLFVCCSIDWIDMFFSAHTHIYLFSSIVCISQHPLHRIPFCCLYQADFVAWANHGWMLRDAMNASHVVVDRVRCPFFWRIGVPQSWTKMMNMTMKFQEPLRDYVWDLKI